MTDRLYSAELTETCPSCSGSGFLTDGGALQRQTCTTDEDCPRCEGRGKVPAWSIRGRDAL